MSDTPQAVRKTIPSKYFAIIGVALVIIGGLAFHYLRHRQEHYQCEPPLKLPQ